MRDAAPAGTALIAPHMGIGGKRAASRAGAGAYRVALETFHWKTRYVQRSDNKALIASHIKQSETRGVERQPSPERSGRAAFSADWQLSAHHVALGTQSMGDSRRSAPARRATRWLDTPTRSTVQWWLAAKRSSSRTCKTIIGRLSAFSAGHLQTARDARRSGLAGSKALIMSHM